LLLAAGSDSPLYMVLQRSSANPERRLIPIASAWFDQTTEVIRVDDADVKRSTAFDLQEFEHMTPEQVTAFERGVLASCCPEVLRDGGPPKYDTASQFKCPDWLTP
jgi:hypothetical protein